MITFFDAFRDLKQTVVWKTPSLPAELHQLVPPNVHLLQWLPQNDLLGHSNTKVFVTHCGSNGQQRALYHGVPMIGFPLYLDQPHNAFCMHAKGFGIQMNIHNFTASDLK